MVEQKGVGYNVQVDVFKVSDDVLARLDMLEGHPKWYVRKQVPIHVKGRTVNCWVYFNPKTITKDTQMHKTYVQHNYRNFYSTPTTETYTPSLWDDMEAILNS